MLFHAELFGVFPHAESTSVTDRPVNSEQLYAVLYHCSRSHILKYQINHLTNVSRFIATHDFPYTRNICKAEGQRTLENTSL